MRVARPRSCSTRLAYSPMPVRSTPR
jgi:hypothetical protein